MVIRNDRKMRDITAIKATGLPGQACGLERSCNNIGQNKLARRPTSPSAIYGLLSFFLFVPFLRCLGLVSQLPASPVSSRHGLGIHVQASGRASAMLSILLFCCTDYM